MVGEEVMSVKIIGLMVVKNEADIIQKTLDSASEWLDGVVVIDNGSTDHTYEICRDHPIVKVFASDKHEFDESYFVPKLHELAMHIEGATWYVDLDADEIYDPKIRDIIEKQGYRANTITVTMKYMLKGECYRINEQFTRIYKNDRSQFEYDHIGKLHRGKVPIPIPKRDTLHSWVDVFHYQIRSREQGLRKYERYQQLDPDNIYQKSYEHLKRVAETMEV